MCGVWLTGLVDIFCESHASGHRHVFISRCGFRVGSLSGRASDDGRTLLLLVVHLFHSPPPHLQSTLLFSQPDVGPSSHSSWAPFVFPSLAPSNCEPVTLPELSLHPASGDGPFLAEATGHCWAVGHYWTSKGPCFWPTPAASLQPLLTGQRVILGSLVTIGLGPSF